MSLHHVEIWVADLESARTEWGWLLERLGYELVGEWAEGFSWGSVDGTYLTLTTSPNTVGTEHDRRRPGLNHLAFRGGARDNVDRIMVEAQENGWRPLYHDRYPHAGGEAHYAGWLENSAGFKTEIVASKSQTTLQ